MRKLVLMLFVLVATLGLTLPTTASPVPAPAPCCSCTEVKSACRAMADTKFNDCRRAGGGWFGCYVDSEDAYQLCVRDASDGKCSIFHD